MNNFDPRISDYSDYEAYVAGKPSLEELSPERQLDLADDDGSGDQYEDQEEREQAEALDQAWDSQLEDIAESF